MSLRIGIDLGGSKIEIIVLDEHGEVLLRERVATPQGNYAATLRAMVDLVRAAEAKVGGGGTALPVGVGIPGAESLATGLIKNANSICLIGQPLRADLSAALGRQVELANDANCFALSEATDGAATGAQTVFGVILGTGVGGGMVIDGKLLVGANAIAGEWGHNPMPGASEGRTCYCGRHDCIETYLCGPALANEVCRATSADFSTSAIIAAALAGDAICEAALLRYEQRLARALATVINLLDPEVIVLGGGLSNLQRLYANVPRLWNDWVFSDQVTTRLVPPRFGDSSGVRGAAWLGAKK
jgi:fructokinase